MGPLSRPWVVALLAAGGLALSVPAAEAQYFGRNKVQYDNFDFKVLKTEHFDIHYYPEVEVEYVALMAERWYARLSRLLDHELSTRQKLIVYASHPHFEQTNALQGALDEGTQGVTEVFKRRIVLPMLGPLKETDHVIGHELVHAFQFDITGQGGGTLLSGVPGALRMPLWFIEGMAEYLSVGPVDAETSMWIRALVSQDKAPEEITDPRFLHPYQHGQALWAYIGGRWGDDVIGRILKSTRTTPSVAAAFQRVLRVSPSALFSQWYDEMRAAAEPLVSQTDRASAFGTPILGKASGSGAFNIAPAISPDGNRVVYLSEKDLFAIEMFLSDAHTGKVEHKIVKAALDPHFEGLQFVNSAGAWSYQGDRFVFAAVRKGNPTISIMDTRRNQIVREEIFRDLGEIYNPSWSPDGRFIVFSALVGGLSDLFIYDLEESSLRRLTNDAYGDMHPVWSPNGEQIAFVTDRFSTGLSSLMYGNYTLATLNPQTGAVREIPAFEKGKHINPQWSPDGKSLYFISDQNGISNVYRRDMETGELLQVTNLFTGIAGIAPLSPAMSVASQTGQMTVSVFLGGAISIYRIDDPDILFGAPVIEEYAAIDPVMLPPVDRVSDDVVALLDNPFFGLPQDSTYSTGDYHAGLGLDYVGQPYLVAGANSFGTFVGGGASLFFSDVLGGRNLGTFFQINGGPKDISVGATYTNQVHRLNWGVQLQQLSFSTLAFQSGFATDPNGQTVFVDQRFRLRQISRSVGGLLSYPLSRVARLELTGGYTNLSYDFEVEQRIFSGSTGALLDDQTRSLPDCGPDDIGGGLSGFGGQLCRPDPLNLGQASAAFVYDNSLYGIASPIMGQRHRIEVAPTVGSLNLWTALVDLRKYVMPVRPFTFAARVMHFGRYGQDDEDSRLQPLFIGWPNLVRGYDISSFEAGECDFDADGNCTTFDQLLGSKMIVANFELRFPPLGVLGLGDNAFGFLPLETGIFFDAGIAWTSDLADSPNVDERAVFLGGERDWVTSTGVSFRFNVFGYFILGADVVHPFQRGKGTHVQFNITPGF